MRRSFFRRVRRVERARCRVCERLAGYIGPGGYFYCKRHAKEGGDVDAR